MRQSILKCDELPELIIEGKVGDDDWNLEVILKEFLHEVQASEQTAAIIATLATRLDSQ